MSKLDKIILSLIAFAFSFVWAAYLTRNIVSGILIAALVTILLYRLAIHFYNRYTLTKRMTATEVANSLALMGLVGQTDFLIKAVPPYFTPIKIDGGFYFTKNLEKTAVFPNIKYSPTNPEEVAKFYRAAKSNGISRMYIISRPSPRNVAIFTSNLDVNASFLPLKKLSDYLYKQNALPEKIKPACKKQKRSIKEVFASFFVRDRIKYLLLTALTLLTGALFAPQKIYYLTIGSICLILSGICLAVDRR